ncbi:MAG TPA: hypothetical protein VGJ06_21430 [Candidatus Acidoferrum sp.]
MFSWQDDAGRVHGCDGYCRDLGSRGIYVTAQLVPPLGASVEMNVFLPRPGHSTRPSEIHAIGRVVRSEQKTPALDVPGFAAMNHTTRLRETRTGNTEPAEAEDYGGDDFSIGRADESNETLSEE